MTDVILFFLNSRYIYYINKT